MRAYKKFFVYLINKKSDSVYRFYVDKELKRLIIQDDAYTDLEKKELQILLKKHQKDLEKMRQLVKDEWKQWRRQYACRRHIKRKLEWE